MPSMIFYLPISFVFALEREFVLAPGNFSNQIKIVLAGELTSFLFLHLCSLTVLKNRKLTEQNLALCILVWALTGVFRGYFAEFYATSILQLESHATLRILVSVTFSTLGLALAAYIFGSIYEIETRKAALRSLHGFISSENLKLNAEQIAMKEEAIVTLQKTLIPKVIQLQRLTSGLKKFELSKQLALALFSLEEQAHRLAYQMRVNLDNLESIPNPRSNITSRLFSTKNVTVKIWPNIFSVKLSILFLFIGGIVVQYGRNSTSGALSSLMSTFLLGVLLIFLDRLSKKVSTKQKPIFFTLGYAILFIAHFICTSQLVPIIFKLSQPFNPLYSAAKVTFAIYLASLFLSFLESDRLMLQTMSKESTDSRLTLEGKSNKNEILESLNITTNQGALQGHISGVILALNLLTKDEDAQVISRNLTETISKANTLLSDAISEIQNLSIKELLN